MSVNHSWTADFPVEDEVPVEAVVASPATTASPGHNAGRPSPWVPRILPPAEPAATNPAVAVPSAPPLIALPDLAPATVDPAAVAAAAPAAAKPVRRVPAEKKKLTRLERFRIWVGRPLLATFAFGGMLLVGVPVVGATYTRESANPMDWRNLSFGEVQARVQHCTAKGGSVGSAVWCDYAHSADTGGLAPRKGRIRRTVVQVPYPVAGPVVYDPVYAPAAEAPAAPVFSQPTAAPVFGPTPGAAGTPRPLPTSPVAGPFPVIQFPAGPMTAIESTCEAAKHAAENKSAAYQQNVEMQCEAAKQAYERSHP